MIDFAYKSLHKWLEETVYFRYCKAAENFNIPSRENGGLIFLGKKCNRFCTVATVNFSERSIPI